MDGVAGEAVGYHLVGDGVYAPLAGLESAATGHKAVHPLQSGALGGHRVQNGLTAIGQLVGNFRILGQFLGGMDCLGDKNGLVILEHGDFSGCRAGIQGENFVAHWDGPPLRLI